MYTMFSCGMVISDGLSFATTVTRTKIEHISTSVPLEQST